MLPGDKLLAITRVLHIKSCGRAWSLSNLLALGHPRSITIDIVGGGLSSRLNVLCRNGRYGKVEGPVSCTLISEIHALPT